MLGFIENVRRIDPERMLRFAERAARAREWPEAVKLYRKCLKTWPDAAPMWVQYGHALKESGDWSQAEDAYRRSLALLPDLPDTHLQLGHVLKLRGRVDEAADAYLRALVLAPTLRDAARELTALGWSPARIQRAQRDAAPGGEADATADAPARTTLLDVSDLVEYFKKTRTPTGIQRVQINVISSLLRDPELSRQIAVVCFTGERDFWIEIPPHLFLELAALAVSGGQMADPVWRDAVAELSTMLSFGMMLEFRGGETLLNLGTSWWLQNYFLMVRYAKAKYGIRYVPFVHDVIPVVAPEHCIKELTQDFINWITGVFFHADDYLVNSQATAIDLKKVAGLLGHTIGEPRVIRLDGRFDLNGADASAAEASAAPLDLPRGPFVLFVGTIESRKNHLLAFNVWLELIRKRGERATPTLVCVGNDGWMTEAAMARLKASELLQRRVRLFRRVSDAELVRLYQDCLFTIYPSTYEGWGLPITEALCFGKAVVTTAVSSLPEAGGQYADYFDPHSMRDLQDKIERLIDDDGYRRSREAKIKAGFQSRGWADIAKEILRKASPANTPARDEPQDEERWVWPLPVESGRFYSLARNEATRVWPGMIGGEMYRMGNRWWAPDAWGNWTKGGLARLAFAPPAEPGAHVLYIGLLGPPLANTRYRVRLLEGDAKARKGELGPGETCWVALTIPEQTLPRGLIHVGIEGAGRMALADMTEEERRIVSVGVKGFYFCREDDLLSRLRFMEALQMNRLEDISGAEAAADCADDDFPDADV